MKLLTFIICIFFISGSRGQNLLEERIRKLSSDKRGIFLNKGIFHNGMRDLKSSISSIRYHYNQRDNYERLVIDFKENKIPRVYGNISLHNKKIHISLFQTSLPESFYSSGKSKFVKSIDFFPIDESILSAEINLKEEIGLEIFYLEEPGRLVLDMRK